MRQVVAAPNALKGSLSAFEAARAISEGVRRGAPGLGVVELPIADGGDGTAEIVCRARGGSFHEVPVLDPLSRPLTARFAMLPDRTAVVDVATASGLALLGPDELSPLRASSYGTGQLLRAALDAGAERILLGVGGSATVDGGAGVLEALGARLLDSAGRPLSRGAEALRHLARIDLSGVPRRAFELPLEIACDVDSPLLGENGAARVFGPQKGALPTDVVVLEQGLSRFATVLAQQLGRDVATLRSGGAAGGIAAALAGVLGARLCRGVDLVLDAVGFDDQIAGASLCITAEGSFDRQSLLQKGPIGVARRAAAHAVPVVALAGAVATDIDLGELPDLAALFSICPRPMAREEAMLEAAPLLTRSAEHVVRLFFARGSRDA